VGAAAGTEPRYALRVGTAAFYAHAVFAAAQRGAGCAYGVNIVRGVHLALSPASRSYVDASIVVDIISSYHIACSTLIVLFNVELGTVRIFYSSMLTMLLLIIRCYSR